MTSSCHQHQCKIFYYTIEIIIIVLVQNVTRLYKLDPVAVKSEGRQSTQPIPMKHTCVQNPGQSLFATLKAGVPNKPSSHEKHERHFVVFVTFTQHETHAVQTILSQGWAGSWRLSHHLIRPSRTSTAKFRHLRTSGRDRDMLRSKPGMAMTHRPWWLNGEENGTQMTENSTRPVSLLGAMNAQLHSGVPDSVLPTNQSEKCKGEWGLKVRISLKQRV